MPVTRPWVWVVLCEMSLRSFFRGRKQQDERTG